MPLQELNEYAKTHSETDIDVDKKAAAEAIGLEKKGKTIIVEGRMQFHFLPKSVKIFIKVSPEEGARRIWKDLQNKEKQEKRNEGSTDSFEAVKRRTFEREEEDAKRYRKYYGFDHRDESHYDFILDTTDLTAKKATEKVLKFIESQS